MQTNANAIRTSTLTLEEAPVTIEVQRKRIRNMYLYVKPGARVVISAPLRFTDEEIRDFALSKTKWLTRQLHTMQNKKADKPLLYETGETLYIWGTPRTITFQPDRHASFTVTDDRVILAMPAGSDRAARERYVKKELKKRLQVQIAKRLPVWEQEMGLYSKSNTVRDMKSRWGSCNIGTAKVTFSLELIRLDPICLDYIIVHELAHLRHARHNRAFWKLVGKYLPEWNRIRSSLDDPEDHTDVEDDHTGN